MLVILEKNIKFIQMSWCSVKEALRVPPCWGRWVFWYYLRGCEHKFSLVRTTQASLTLFLLRVGSCRVQWNSQFLGCPPRWAGSFLNSFAIRQPHILLQVLTSQILRLALKSVSPRQPHSPRQLLSSDKQCLIMALPTHTGFQGAELQLVSAAIIQL